MVHLKNYVLIQSFSCKNNNGFDAVIDSVTGPILNIKSNNTSSTDVINWMVIAERADYHIIDSTNTNKNGYLITEYDTGLSGNTGPSDHP